MIRKWLALQLQPTGGRWLSVSGGLLLASPWAQPQLEPGPQNRRLACAARWLVCSWWPLIDPTELEVGVEPAEKMPPFSVESLRSCWLLERANSASVRPTKLVRPPHLVAPAERATRTWPPTKLN